MKKKEWLSRADTDSTAQALRQFLNQVANEATLISGDPTLWVVAGGWGSAAIL